jgi:3-oxoacyl-[acyl-carrier protein] reductase
VKTALDTYGALHIVINNAGTTHRNQPLLDVTEEQFDRVYAVNVKSLYWSARHCVPVFRTQGGGVFVTIASTAGVRPRPGLTWYNGSKGAAILVSRSMAVELAPDKIRVNVINPVAGETPLLAQFMGGADSPRCVQVHGGIPLGRLSQPRDVPMPHSTSRPVGRFITGTCIGVDGGRCV